MKKRHTFHRLLAMLLAVLCCTIPMASVSAADDLLDETDMAASDYTVDGIDVYLEPAVAASHFHIEELIYFTVDQVNTLADDRVAVVNTTDDLIALAKEKPFAALVVDAKAEPFLDRDKIIKLSQTQHIILLIGFDAPQEKELALYEKLMGRSAEEYKNSPGFGVYYVVSDTGEIHLWNLIWCQNLVPDNLLDFLEQEKQRIFYLYDCLVLQSHPEIVAEINNAPIPPENIISENNTESYTNWDPSVNRRINIFNPQVLSVTTVAIYASTSYSSNKVMTCGIGEAILFTNYDITSDNHRWFEVSGWKQTSSGSTYVTGWLPSFYAPSYTLDVECYSLYQNGSYLDAESSKITYNKTRDAFGYTLTSAAKLYDSTGTVMKTLSRGDIVWITNDEGYAGATKPFLVSIDCYSIGNTTYSQAGAVFADLNFDSGNTGTYRIVTHA